MKRPQDIGPEGERRVTRGGEFIERNRINLESDLLLPHFVAEGAEAFDARFVKLPQRDDLVAAMDVVDVAYQDIRGGREWGPAWAS